VVQHLRRQVIIAAVDVKRQNSVGRQKLKLFNF
jgi:hypothetical protein